MYEILILLAGLALGLAHEADKRQESHRAYQAGRASVMDKPRAPVEAAGYAPAVPVQCLAASADKPKRDHKQTIRAVYHRMQATGRGTARMQ